jgi:hypothetical protein
VQHLRDFSRFEMNKPDLDEIEKSAHEQALSVLQIIWEFLSLEFGCGFKTPLRKFVKTETF